MSEPVEVTLSINGRDYPLRRQIVVTESAWEGDR